MAPRPRPTAKPAIPKPVAAGPSHNISYDNVKDDDEMFMRNRGGWAKLRKLNKETEQNQKEPTVDKDKDKDSDSDDLTTRPLKRKGETSPLVRPRWQTDKKYVTRLLSEELSDDSDDSITIQDVQNDRSNTKRKREPANRARSKSITPPPAIPQYQLENAREIIRKTLGTRHDSSPDVEDTFEEEETIVLDPQLAKIAQNVKSQSSLAGHTRSSTEPTSNDVVNITVRWEPHPLNGHGTRDVWGFKLDVNENFSTLFESVAEEASIMLDKLVMTYRGKRFFSSISPHTLNIWSDAEFIACDLPTFEYKRRVAEEQLHSQAQPPTQFAKPKDTNSNVVEIDSDSDDQSAVGPSGQNNRDNEGESETEAAPASGMSGAAGDDRDDQDQFKLVLRSGLTSNTISLNVRSTTKCGAIIKAFLKKAGLADKYPPVFEPEAAAAPQKKTKSSKSAVASSKIPKLSIDGDKADNETEIGEYGLEDGDMVEVVDL